MICVDAYAQADDIRTLTEEELEELGDDEEAIENLKKNKMVNYLLTQFNKKSQSGNVFVGARDEGFFVIDGDRYAVIDEKFNLSLVGDGVSESTENYLISSTEEWAFKKIDEANCAITAYLGEELSGVMVIPSIVIDKESGQAYNVTSLGDDIFSSSYISGVDFSAVANTLKSIGNRTFMRCTNLTIQVPNDLPSTVTKIGSSAFNGCKKLTGSIDDVIAKNYKLGTNTFANCPGLTGSIQLVFDQNYPKTADIEDLTALTEEQTIVAAELLKGLDGLTGALVIPSYITKIGDSAFEDCKGITSLTFEGTSDGTSRLTEIGENAFYNCVGIANSIVFPSTLATLNNYAFYNANKITGATLDEALTKIGARCFSHCSKLTGTITIPYGIEETEEYIFYSTSIQTLVFQTKTINSITYGCNTIGDYSFGFCGSLSSITLPSTLETIGEGGFDSLPLNINISLPNGLVSIGTYAFRNCAGLDVTSWPSTLKVLGGSSFYCCQNLKNLPDVTSLERIGGNAFLSCKLLSLGGAETVNIIEWVRNATSLNYIGAEAFTGCSKLTGTLNVDKSNLEIFGREIDVSATAFSKTQVKKGGIFNLAGEKNVANYRFQGWSVFYDLDETTVLTELTIPEGVTSIGYGSFKQATGVEVINLPKSLTSIQGEAFSGCGIRTFNFEDCSLTSIPESCFYNSWVTSINLPSGIIELGNLAFSYCRHIKEIELPSSLTRINYGALQYTTLESMDIPDGVTYLGNNAFEGSTSTFESVVVPSGVTYVGSGCFKDCIYLKNITFQNSLNIVPENCLSGCFRLKTVTFSSSITGFSDNCFYGCSLLNSIIDSSKQNNIFDWGYVTNVGNNAFKNCTSMRGIYTVNRGATISDTATSGCNDELFYIHK